MWLINVKTLQLEYFHSCETVEYAILSHTWQEGEELDFHTFRAGGGKEKLGYNKIVKCCELARDDDLSYAWVDTCCIDKRSSAELSEAINSMFQWYKCAAVCYAYLCDFFWPKPGVALTGQAFAKCAWFTRGWTLQELLAPRLLRFRAANWSSIGDKVELAGILSKMTGIDSAVLNGSSSLEAHSVATKMSWATERQTTRQEDIAYCLLGLFGVSMPLLYGEGSTNAFQRLQKAIIGLSNDETIFAWSGVPDAGCGMLASSPRAFARCALTQVQQWSSPRPPYAVTNRGLFIECEVFPLKLNLYLVPLRCLREGKWLGICLCRTTTDGQYLRVPFSPGIDLAFVQDPFPYKFAKRSLYVDKGLDLILAYHNDWPRIGIRCRSNQSQLDPDCTSNFGVVNATQEVFHNLVISSAAEHGNFHILSTAGRSTVVDGHRCSYVRNLSKAVANSAVAGDVSSQPKLQQESDVTHFVRQSDASAGVLIPCEESSVFSYIIVGFSVDFEPICVFRLDEPRKMLIATENRPNMAPRTEDSFCLSNNDNLVMPSPGGDMRGQVQQIWLLKGDRDFGLNAVVEVEDETLSTLESRYRIELVPDPRLMDTKILALSTWRLSFERIPRKRQHVVK